MAHKKGKTFEAHERKRKAIKSDFDKMDSDRTEKGTKKYTLQYILEKLAEKYFLSTKRIYSILFVEKKAAQKVTIKKSTKKD